MAVRPHRTGLREQLHATISLARGRDVQLARIKATSLVAETLALLRRQRSIHRAQINTAQLARAILQDLGTDSVHRRLQGVLQFSKIILTV